MTYFSGRAPVLANGYYWLRTTHINLATKYRQVNSAEIVRVERGYTFRNKVVPMVIGLHWKCPLAKCDESWYWAGPIEEPTL